MNTVEDMILASSLAALKSSSIWFMASSIRCPSLANDGEEGVLYMRCHLNEVQRAATGTFNRGMTGRLTMVFEIRTKRFMRGLMRRIDKKQIRARPDVKTRKRPRQMDFTVKGCHLAVPTTNNSSYTDFLDFHENEWLLKSKAEVHIFSLLLNC